MLDILKTASDDSLAGGAVGDTVNAARCVVHLANGGYRGSKESPVPLANLLIELCSRQKPSVPLGLQVSLAWASMQVLGYKHIRLLKVRRGCRQFHYKWP